MAGPAVRRSFFRKKGSNEGDIRDIRRLFYVALTRAKKHAVILVPLEESDGRTLTPLRFIDELDEKNLIMVTVPRADQELPAQNFIQDADDTAARNKKIAESEYSKKMTDLAKHVLLTTGLSVTALNHFLECPNKFLYESILKLPQAPSASAEKGTAMHEAISAVWHDTELRTEVKQQTEAERPAGKIEEIIVKKTSEYLAESFLSIREKEAVKKELIEDAPAVAKALLSHFNEKGRVLTESFARASFQGSYDVANEPRRASALAPRKGERVVIPIHGKLDAILDTGSETKVFDYKTRQAMSVAAIKGETKTSDGDYFRQLVFYKLLLADDPRFKMRKIRTALVFVSPDKKGRCPIIELDTTENDIAAVKTQIQSVIDSVWSGAIATNTCSDPDCVWCNLKTISSS